jgi:hypothetical protein
MIFNLIQRASMKDDQELPVCKKCNAPVTGFSCGSQSCRGTIYFFESKCHGDVERFEYRPVSPRDPLFEPKHAFPSDTPAASQIGPEPGPGAPKGLLEIQDELFAMPEWKTVSRIRLFGTSIRLFRSNTRDLLAFLDHLTIGPHAGVVDNVDKRVHLDEALEEVLRLLHNFVASAMSLVDHSRVMFKELYERSERFPEYLAQVKLRFADKPLVQFVNGLRQFAQHYKTPGIGYHVAANRDTGMSRMLVLPKADLLGFSGWNAAAKIYLVNAPQQIDIRAVTKTYEGAVDEFYAWMESRQLEIHAAELAALKVKQHEVSAALGKELPSLVESMLQIRAIHGVGSLRDVFAVALAPEEQLKLEPLRTDLPKWLEAALVFVESRVGPLPVELVAKLRETASAHADAHLASPPNASVK